MQVTPVNTTFSWPKPILDLAAALAAELRCLSPFQPIYIHQPPASITKLGSASCRRNHGKSEGKSMAMDNALV